MRFAALSINLDTTRVNFVDILIPPADISQSLCPARLAVKQSQRDAGCEHFHAIEQLNVTRADGIKRFAKQDVTSLRPRPHDRLHLRGGVLRKAPVLTRATKRSLQPDQSLLQDLSGTNQRPPMANQRGPSKTIIYSE